MNNKLLKFLSNHADLRDIASNGEFLLLCPKCKHANSAPHFYVNPEMEAAQCFKCHYATREPIEIVQALSGWSVTKVIKYLQQGATLETAAQNLYEKAKNRRAVPTQDYYADPIVHLPPEFRLINEPSDMPEYAKQRRLTFKTCVRWGLGVCQSGFYADRLIVPVFDVRQILVTFVARTMVNAVPKVLYPKHSQTGSVLFNEEWASTTDTIVVTEGVFDSLRVGKRGVALLGNAATAMQQARLIMLGASRRIVLLLDSDAQEATMKLIDQLRPFCLNLSVTTLPRGRKDPDSCSREQLRRVIDAASDVRQLEIQTLIQRAKR